MLINKEIVGGDLNEVMANAASIERSMFEQALRDTLVCEPLPEEERIRDDFPHNYWDKKEGKYKTARCEPSYALKLNLEPREYHSNCVNAVTEYLYWEKKGQLMKGESNDPEPAARSRKRRDARKRRVRTPRNRQRTTSTTVQG
jgi:hypothetical protein